MRLKWIKKINCETNKRLYLLIKIKIKIVNKRILKLKETNKEHS